MGVAGGSHRDDAAAVGAEVLPDEGQEVLPPQGEELPQLRLEALRSVGAGHAAQAPRPLVEGLVLGEEAGHVPGLLLRDLGEGEGGELESLDAMEKLAGEAIRIEGRRADLDDEEAGIAMGLEAHADGSPLHEGAEDLLAQVAALGIEHARQKLGRHRLVRFGGGGDEGQGHPGLLHVGHQVAGAGLHDLGLDEAGGALLFERRPGGEGPCRHEGEVLAAQGTGDDHQEVGGAEDGAGEVRQGLGVEVVPVVQGAGDGASVGMDGEDLLADQALETGVG